MGETNIRDKAGLGAKIAGFARRMMHKKVGVGECWDLPEEALSAAGAKTSNDLQTIDPSNEHQDYRWGVPIELKNIAPGDLLQFKKHRAVVTTTNVDGSWNQRTFNRGHHSAIAGSRPDKAHRVSVYEQKINGVKKVASNTVYLVSSGGKGESVHVVVTGHVSAYRAIAK